MKSPRNAPARWSMSAPISRKPISKVPFRAKAVGCPSRFPSCHRRARSRQRAFGRDDALVDADDAVFKRLRDAPDAADVAAVEIGGAPSPPSPAGGGGLGWGCRWPS